MYCDTQLVFFTSSSFVGIPLLIVCLYIYANISTFIVLIHAYLEFHIYLSYYLYTYYVGLYFRLLLLLNTSCELYIDFIYYSLYLF